MFGSNKISSRPCFGANRSSSFSVIMQEAVGGSYGISNMSGILRELRLQETDTQGHVPMAVGGIYSTSSTSTSASFFTAGVYTFNVFLAGLTLAGVLDAPDLLGVFAA